MEDAGSTAPAAYRFWTEEKLRNADTDRQGHVNNAVIATFLESGRIDVLDNPVLAEVRKVTGIVVVRLLVNYRKELFFPGKVRVGTRLDRAGRTSLTFGQAVYSGDALIADAEVTCVLVDKATRKPVPVPEEMRAFLAGP